MNDKCFGEQIHEHAGDACEGYGRADDSPMSRTDGNDQHDNQNSDAHPGKVLEHRVPSIIGYLYGEPFSKAEQVSIFVICAL